MNRVCFFAIILIPNYLKKKKKKKKKPYVFGTKIIIPKTNSEKQEDRQNESGIFRRHNSYTELIFPKINKKNQNLCFCPLLNKIGLLFLDFRGQNHSDTHFTSIM